MCTSGQLGREALARKYQGRAQFVFVYSQEAHSDAPALSTAAGAFSGPTRTWAERAERARAFHKAHQSGRRILVDEDGERSASRQYGGRSNHLVVVGTDGRIVFKQEFANAALLGTFLGALLGDDDG
jgi:hypothetical protein